ncbi:6325_t:CDS:2 [Gigaspora margarita]|uniref:6325_t:CDS:1 n=1 Tax=Gigaspora margarita TaxID=4874 RepID=A0ABM8W3G0_GIGMA|nr:6325_t:CDS:2 [Gigaspora margarita]
MTLTDSTTETTLKPTPVRRNRPGTKFEDAYQFPHITLDKYESAFALQEYLQSLIRTNKEDIDLLVELPPGHEEDTWQYEHLRQLCLELNYLVIQLEAECNRQSCPEMKADEWMYLCAAHPNPTNVETSIKYYQSIARRLYRIFAHAWFHHREIFEAFENENLLYARFLKLSDRYGLVAKNLLIIPQNNNIDNDDRDNTPSSDVSN